MQLNDIAEYVTEKICSDMVSIENYVTTDCLLPNKQGRTTATNLPPQKCSLTKYQVGDVLVANIRPYLKKIWRADNAGGASADVLVFRSKNGHFNKYLYAVLMQDSFYDWSMKGPKGSRMPRGDKNQIMRFPICDIGNEREIFVGDLLSDIDAKINLNRQINRNLATPDYSSEMATARLAA